MKYEAEGNIDQIFLRVIIENYENKKPRIMSLLLFSLMVIKKRDNPIIYFYLISKPKWILSSIQLITH